jgi:hypothetical protein
MVVRGGPGENMELDPSVVAAINEDFDEIYRNIDDDNVAGDIEAEKTRTSIIEDVIVTTAETAVPHNLGKEPSYYFVVPKNAATWYENRRPDRSFIYLKVSTGSMTANVIAQG